MYMEEFKINIKGIVEQVTGEKVILKKVKKNNNVELEGIMIDDTDRTPNTLSPVIYLEEYLKDYNNGKSLFQIADSIIKKINDNKLADVGKVNMLQSWELVKDMVKAKLVNYDKNVEYLSEIPHKRILDLAIICYIEIEDTVDNGIATATINEQLLNLYEVDFEKVLSYAFKNMKDFKIQRMEEVLLESLIGTDDVSEEEKQLVMDSMYGEGNNIPMYVLSSKNKHFGAIGIIDQVMMRKFGETINSDFYIIPSSIHEAILVPDTKIEQDELKKMIQSVNDEQVEEEEILSYSLYWYECKTGEIKLAS